jgi:hypothetical protein
MQCTSFLYKLQVAANKLQAIVLVRLLLTFPLHCCVTHYSNQSISPWGRTSLCKPTSNYINAVFDEHTEWQQASTECTDIQEQLRPKNLQSGQHNKGNDPQGYSESLTAVRVKIQVFWNVTLCLMVKSYQNSEGLQQCHSLLQHRYLFTRSHGLTSWKAFIINLI